MTELALQFWVQKYFGFTKIVGQKYFVPEKNSDQKILLTKNIWDQKNFCPKVQRKFLVPDKFWAKANIES